MELPSTEKLARSLNFEDDSKAMLLKELAELEQLLAKRLELSMQKQTPSGMHDPVGHAASMDGKMSNGQNECLVRKACMQLPTQESMHEAPIHETTHQELKGAASALEAREAGNKLAEVNAPPAVHQRSVSQSLST